MKFSKSIISNEGTLQSILEHSRIHMHGRQKGIEKCAFSRKNANFVYFEDSRSPICVRQRIGSALFPLWSVNRAIESTSKVVTPLMAQSLGHFGIPGIGLELACNGGSCGGISSRIRISLSCKLVPVQYREYEYGLLLNHFQTKTTLQSTPLHPRPCSNFSRDDQEGPCEQD